MDAEIEAAVSWWADQLAGDATHDNGDLPLSLFATALAGQLAPLLPQQIESFKASLAMRLREDFAPSWDSSDPMRGSYGRTLGVDYNPDARLRQAAEDAGIGALSLRFPCKTMMWVDPGKVQVAKGYGAKPVTILDLGASK